MLQPQDIIKLKALYEKFIDKYESKEKSTGNSISQNVTDIKYSLKQVDYSISNDRTKEISVEDWKNAKFSLQGPAGDDIRKRIQESFKHKEPFKVQLVKYIDKKGYRRDSHFYLKCGITRQHFSKIVGWRKMIPQKKTVIVMALVLNLTIEEAEEFLSSANYLLSEYNKTDIVVRYCFEYGIYELEDVNEALEIFEEGPLI